MKEGTRNLSRRSFLLAVGAGSAATGAALVVTGKPSASSPISVKGKRSTRGYHASEHINTYYRTTKI